jgi:hypothetical protein
MLYEIDMLDQEVSAFHPLEAGRALDSTAEP